VAAALWVGYPGQSGGDAIADVLFGVYNPGGRLPYTVYRGDYVTNLSMFDMNMRPNPPSNPGRTYRFFNGTTVFPFGYGLSYTTFGYSLSTSGATIKLPGDLHAHAADITITVTNTGSVPGSDAVLAYLVPPTPGVNGLPLKSLVGFERVFLNPGQSITLVFPVPAQAFSPPDEHGAFVPRPGIWTALAYPPRAVTPPTAREQAQAQIEVV
jgi:beta-D-xylosidase 4